MFSPSWNASAAMKENPEKLVTKKLHGEKNSDHSQSQVPRHVSEETLNKTRQDQQKSCPANRENHEKLPSVVALSY